jgi:transposase
MMLASVNKTDKLDCFGLNRLQYTGTLPTVLIPPAEIRDLRDLPRTRMVLTRHRGRLKNRIHATLAKYGITIERASYAFGKWGRQVLEAKLAFSCATSQLLLRGETLGTAGGGAGCRTSYWRAG